MAKDLPYSKSNTALSVMLILNIYEHLYQKNLEKAFRLKMHLFRFFQAQGLETRHWIPEYWGYWKRLKYQGMISFFHELRSLKVQKTDNILLRSLFALQPIKSLIPQCWQEDKNTTELIGYLINTMISTHVAEGRSDLIGCQERRDLRRMSSAPLNSWAHYFS